MSPLSASRVLRTATRAAASTTLAAVAAAACADVTSVPAVSDAPALRRGEGESEIRGGKTCRGFTLRFSDGRVLSGRQKVSLAEVSGTVVVQGQFAQFTLDPATFTVRNYTLNGVAIFARKTPLHGQALTRPLSVELNNEQLVLQRTSANGRLDMKVQAKDCNQGGIFQMEPESDDVAAIVFEHELAPGFSYFDPNSATARTFFRNGTAAGSLLGYESPELATRVLPALGAPVGGTVARFSVQNGGRMGMVVGEDAQEGLLQP